MAERTIATRLTLNVQDFVAGTKAAHQSLDQLVKAGDKTGQVASTGLGRMAQSMQLRSAEWRTASTTLMGVGAAQTAVTAAVAKTGIQYNMLQQTSRAAMKSLTGSAAAANAQMDKLDAFAKTSPFSKATFIQAQQQMMAFGIEAKKVIPYLDGIQNAVAAAGGNDTSLRGIVEIMAKIQSSAKITGTDLMQFGNWGINAAELIGSAMGKTGAQIKQEITAGTLDAGVALDALAQGMSTKFAGAASNVKNSFAGALDRVKAAFRDLSGSLMDPFVGAKGGGILTGLVNSLADVLRWVEKLPAPIRNTGAALGALGGFGALGVGALMKLIPAAVETHRAFVALGSDGIPILSKGIQRLQAIPGNIKGVFSGLVEATAATQRFGGEFRMGMDLGMTKAQAFRSAAMPALSGVGSAARFAGSALLGAFGGPVGLAITGVVAGITAIANASARAKARVEAYSSALAGLGDGASAAEKQMATARAAMEAAINNDVDWGWLQSGVLTAGKTLKSYNDALSAAGISAGEYGMAVAGMTGYQDKFRASVEAAYEAGKLTYGQRNDIIGVMEKEAAAVVTATEAAADLAAGEEELAASIDGAAGATDGQADSLDNAADKAASYRDALQALADWQRAQADSQWAANSALADFHTQMGAAAGETFTFAGGLDLATEAGAKNQAALDAIAESTYDTIAAMAEAQNANGDFIYSEADLMGVLAEGQAKLADGYEVATGGAADFREQAEAANEALGLTPETVEIMMLLRGAAEIPEELEPIRDLIESFPPKVITAMSVMGIDASSAAIDSINMLLAAGFEGDHVANLLARDKSGEIVQLAAQAIDAGYSKEWVASLLADDQAGPGVVQPLKERLQNLVNNPYTAVLKATDNASSKASWVQRAVEAIPTSWMTTLKAKDEGSWVARGFAAMLNNIPSTKTTTIKTVYDNVANPYQPWKGKFRGGIVEGLNAGGLVPGRRAGFDNVLWPLHSSVGVLSQPLEGGEFVVNSAATAKHGGLLDAINRGVDVTGLLGGGYAGVPVSAGSGSVGSSLPPLNVDARVTVVNPFTSEEVEARVASTVVKYV